MLNALNTSMNAMSQASQNTYRLAQEIASPAQVPAQPAVQEATDPKDRTDFVQQSLETGEQRNRLNQLVELKQTELQFMASAKAASMVLDAGKELLEALD